MTADGLISVSSGFGVAETVDRLDAEIRSRGLSVFARIDHAAGAAEAGMVLRPTTLIIFGSAKGGTPLMQIDQAVGIDLPLKALVTEDASGRVWLSYNAPHWIARRHALGAAADRTVEALAATLSAIVKAVTSGQG